ncbi:cytochrome P450 [Pseudonocardia sp. C8]|nr:cytochrome P450 [Pseudonocardia sp. C8]
MANPASINATNVFAQILDAANRPDPYPFYARLRDQPVTQIDEHAWVVSTHREITRLLRDPRISADRRLEDAASSQPPRTDGTPRTVPFIRQDFQRQDPPDHDRLRRLVMHQFVPRTMGMRDHIDDLVQRSLDVHATQEAGQLDIVADLAYPLPVTIICEILGVPQEDEPSFREFARILTRSLDPIESLTDDEQHEMQATAMEFRDYLVDLIQKRMAHPGDDLLSGLLAGGDPAGSMELVDVGATLALLLIAGHETTVNLIANGTLALMRHPEVLERLRDNPALATSLVEEVLRYDPPVQMSGRSTLADIEIAGVTIPQGDRVSLLLAAGNRDPDRFTEPDFFWPERPNNAHLAFGGGIHYCIGATLARAEAQIALSAVARRLENPRLVMDPPPYRANAALRGPDRLPIAFDQLLAPDRP